MLYTYVWKFDVTGTMQTFWELNATLAEKKETLLRLVSDRPKYEFNVSSVQKLETLLI